MQHVLAMVHLPSFTVAGNWGPFPDAYLDARTLSFPMPR